MSNLRHAAAALGAVGLMLASALPAGAAAPKKVRVPNLYGRSVPRAEYILRAAGLRVGREDCDCSFGMIIKSNWVVCTQIPAAGRLVAREARVTTFSEREVSDC
jgi:beta-lactam-binding protein with PASTA domain